MATKSRTGALSTEPVAHDRHAALWRPSRLAALYSALTTVRLPRCGVLLLLLLACAQTVAAPSHIAPTDRSQGEAFVAAPNSVGRARSEPSTLLTTPFPNLLPSSEEGRALSESSDSGEAKLNCSNAGSHRVEIDNDLTKLYAAVADNNVTCIKLQPGTYALTKTIVIKHPLAIVAEGGQAMLDGGTRKVRLVALMNDVNSEQHPDVLLSHLTLSNGYVGPCFAEDPICTASGGGYGVAEKWIDTIAAEDFHAARHLRNVRTRPASMPREVNSGGLGLEAPVLSGPPRVPSPAAPSTPKTAGWSCATASSRVTTRTYASTAPPVRAPCTHCSFARRAGAVGALASLGPCAQRVRGVCAVERRRHLL
mgnify:CR=1 FL=1